MRNKVENNDAYIYLLEEVGNTIVKSTLQLNGNDYRLFLKSVIKLARINLLGILKIKSR